MILEECRYVVKDKKINNYITDDVELSSDSDEEDLLEKIQRKKILIVEKILMKKLWKKFGWKKILMKKVKYNFFSGFSGWSSFIFRTWAEKCRFPFSEI